MFQLGLMFSVCYWFIDYLLFDGGIFINIYNNYDKFKFLLLFADFILFCVCMYICDYVCNDVYFNNLQVNYFVDLGNGFYGQVYGGYLEMMYVGVGFELFYCLLDVSWVLGVDVNYVKQCDWDNMMCFIDYFMLIGFVMVYWNLLMFNGVLMKFSVG